MVGSHCILANAATLAGHVTIEDYVTAGRLLPSAPVLHRGQHAFIGGGTIVTQDVLPFSLTSARRENKAFGINKIGLARRGFSPERLQTLQKPSECCWQQSSIQRRRLRSLRRCTKVKMLAVARGLY